MDEIDGKIIRFFWIMNHSVSNKRESIISLWL